MKKFVITKQIEDYTNFMYNEKVIGRFPTFDDAVACVADKIISYMHRSLIERLEEGKKYDYKELKYWQRVWLRGRIIDFEIREIEEED